jgi:membrane fusion protein (multidrug efflux system)
LDLKGIRESVRLMLRQTSMVALLALAACSSGKDSGQAGSGGGRRNQGTPTVGYVLMKPTSVEMDTELSGRTSAFESSDVRPQVNGIIRRRLFTEGTLVHEGQVLYEIDPRVYRAAAGQAQANLESARANAEATKALADRYKPLADMEAISRQDYTNALAAARQASASVAQTSAALEAAKVNLQFTTVPAPITGRIGRSLFTVGALVSTSQVDPLAQIQRLDPMFVDIQQSSADMLSLRRALARDGIVATRAVVKLTLEDGEVYGHEGSVEFSEAIVNQQTGTVTLRARFPNAEGLLLPGMFVRARFAQAINQRAFLVPQTAVARDPKGNATLFVVEGDKVVQRSVRADRAQDIYWVVTGGLKAGDKVVTQGLAKITPNLKVKSVPAGKAEKIEAPSKDVNDAAGDAGSKKSG